MCGLVGVFTNRNNGFDYKELDIFEQMLWIDSLRGMDSTGIFSVSNNNQLRVVKQAASGDVFIKTPHFKKAREAAFKNGKVLVGHNRKATIGEVSNDTAHPFIEKPIVLVHNGTVPGYGSLTEKSVSVDSHAITCSFAEKGELETLKTLDGAWALIWYNMEKGTLSFARNEDRPLYLAQADNAWFWMSEKGMLEMILDRNNIKPKFLGSLKPFKIFSLNKSNKVKEVEVPQVKKSQAQGIGFTPPPSSLTKTITKADTTKPHIALVEKKTPFTSDQKKLLKEVTDTYPIQSQVLFIPYDMNESPNHKQFELTGRAYLPNREDYDASCWLPPTMGRVEAAKLFNSNVPVTAVVRSITLHENTDDPHIYLSNLECGNIVRDFEGSEFSYLEAEEICSSLPCTMCGDVLDSEKVSLSILERDKDDMSKYNCVCPKCVSKMFKPDTDK